MKIILISADGLGAGKTTLSRKLSEENYSLADSIRDELSEEYPEVDFFNKTQEYKNSMVRDTGKSVRDLLISRGQNARTENPEHWVSQLIIKIKSQHKHNEYATITVDDIRFENEVVAFRKAFTSVVHVHIWEGTATPEPQYENNLLFQIADYKIIRR